MTLHKPGSGRGEEAAAAGVRATAPQSHHSAHKNSRVLESLEIANIWPFGTYKMTILH